MLFSIRFNIVIFTQFNKYSMDASTVIFNAVNIDKYSPYTQKLFWDPP